MPDLKLKFVLMLCHTTISAIALLIYYHQTYAKVVFVVFLLSYIGEKTKGPGTSLSHHNRFYQLLYSRVYSRSSELQLFASHGH
jgi:hypothetical protein